MTKSKIIAYTSVCGLVAGIFMFGGEDATAMNEEHNMHKKGHMHMMHVANGEVHAHSHDYSMNEEHHMHKKDHMHMMHVANSEVHAH